MRYRKGPRREHTHFLWYSKKIIVCPELWTLSISKFDKRFFNEYILQEQKPSYTSCFGGLPQDEGLVGRRLLEQTWRKGSRVQSQHRLWFYVCIKLSHPLDGPIFWSRSIHRKVRHHLKGPLAENALVWLTSTSFEWSGFWARSQVSRLDPQKGYCEREMLV